MVRTNNIAKHFKDPKKGSVKAVDGITIEALPGRIVGLLGANGAGKTTLLRMLSTVIKPTSGSAEIAGHDVVREPEQVRASIGFMSNSTALYGRLTAREILAYFGSLYGLEDPLLTKRLGEVMDRLEIGPFADQLCDKLSTGQKQRVSIARTILHDPPVLFFDEPTVGLDVISSQTVMEFIEGARASGKTVIYCTHIMTEVERLCDHVYVVDEGVVRGQGSVEDLIQTTGAPSLEKAFLTMTGHVPAGGWR